MPRRRWRRLLGVCCTSADGEMTMSVWMLLNEDMNISELSIYISMSLRRSREVECSRHIY